MSSADVRVVTCGGGAAWEAPLIQGLQRRELGVEVVRRCVDHGELVGIALRERPRAAIVAAELPWLDRELVGTLHDAGVTVMAIETVVGLRPLQRFGVHHRLDPTVSAEQITALLVGLGGPPEVRATTPVSGGGQLMVVWGAPGSPGRSTTAWHVAEEYARTGHSTVLIDGDGWAPCIAQLTGVGEGPSLTKAARLAVEGWPEPLTSCLHPTASGLRVLPGLPRADLWPEVRERAWRAVLDAARDVADVVVVDVASAIEEDEELSFDRAPYRRNLMTRIAIEEADHLLVLANGDPIGLRRLIFSHRLLVETFASAPARASVIVNRVPSAARRRRELADELERWAGLRPAAMLPHEPAFERSVWDGRPLHDIAPRSGWLSEVRRLPVLAGVRP